MTRPDILTTMDAKDRPATPDAALLAAFAHGGRDQIDRLNVNLGLLTRRLNHAFHRWHHHNTHFLGLINRLLEDISRASGLLQPLPHTHFTDNIRFIEVVDKLGTPQSKYLARQLHQQRELARNPKSEDGESIRPPIIRHLHRTENEQLSAGEEVHFHDPLAAMRLLLEKEQALFPENEHNALMDRTDKLDGPAKECNSVKIGLDAVTMSLDPIYALSERFELILGSIARLEEQTRRLNEIEENLSQLEGETSTDLATETANIVPVQMTKDAGLRRLEAKLASEMDILGKNEAIIDGLLATDKRLMPAIDAILKDIQVLCGELMNVKLEGISEWKIGLAEIGWVKIKTDLPKNSALSGIQPDIVNKAFAFLKAHEDFLAAQNMVRNARNAIAGIEFDISAAKEHSAAMERIASAMKNERAMERDRHRARLEKTAGEARRRIDQSMTDLFAELDQLRKESGMPGPLETMEPDKFWAGIEKWLGGGALLDAQKALDAIEPVIHRLNQEALM